VVGGSREADGKAMQYDKKLVTKKKVASKKLKIEKPMHVEIELLVNEYNISAADYHGGTLSSVDCQRLIHYASVIFPTFKCSYSTAS
jgi:hypothetical protein